MTDDNVVYLVNYDYSTGDPRQHHSMYLEDGNFVMQVLIICCDIRY